MKRILAGLATLFAATPAFAVDKLYTPYVEKGEWALEYFGRRTVDKDSTKDNAQEHQLSLEYIRTVAECDYAYTRDGKMAPIGLRGI